MKPVITLRLPEPHIETEIDGDALRPAIVHLQQGGFPMFVIAEKDYPICNSWAELALGAGSFVGLAVLTHYLETFLDVFDAYAKKTITSLDLTILASGKGVGKRIPLRDRTAAKKALGDAFFQLNLAINDPGATIYLFEAVRVTEDGAISFETSGSGDGTRQGRLHSISETSEDYLFWSWLLEDLKPRRNFVDSELAELKANFELQGKQTGI